MSVFSAACWLLKVTDPGTWSLPVSVGGLGGFQHSEPWTRWSPGRAGVLDSEQQSGTADV